MINIPNSSISKASKTSYQNVSSSSPSPDDKKFIYSFDEGSKEMKDLLGGKGSNLAEMTNIGIPVPSGFTITTKVCCLFLKENNYPTNFVEQLNHHLKNLEAKTGKKLGDAENPLLVSVRSGSVFSMPGMMDTILNLGLNDETVKGLAKKTDNPRFAMDCYRRFIHMFGDVVMGVEHELFEDAIDKLKKEKNVKNDTELTGEDLVDLIEIYKEIIKKETGKLFPNNPLEQLKMSIEAVFNSWDNNRARTYRKINHLSDFLGTAVNIQAMVFGNMGEDSGTGVAFTRNPSNGEKEFYGEFLMNAQGEDVVAGIRDPLPLKDLEKVNKQIYDQLVEIKNKLEKHYKDMQDIEFTIEQGTLYLLQTRKGKRTAQAAIKIAHDMTEEKLLTKKEALLTIDAKQLDQLLHPQISKDAEKKVIAKGLPASPGAASGKIVFNSEDAVDFVENKKEKVILARKETSPEDISGMHSASGILTSRGGMTSHAAVVARGMGKCCVAGCSEITIDCKSKKIIIDDLVLKEGDKITLDGNTGEVLLGELKMEDPELVGTFKIIMEWADEFRKLKIRTNADNPVDCKKAIEFGAEGIGLCRTEHMFFEEDRIHLIRQMILSKNLEERKKPLIELKKYQINDFKEIFKVMNGKPITIRLLDPPLHEFLPNTEAQIKELSEDFNVSIEEIQSIIDRLQEINPMLGHRGCRLGITYPEIYEMQVQAISEAGIDVSKKGEKANIEIEIPLIGNVRELEFLKEVVQKTISEYGDQINFNYKIGTMIEVPRACLTANKIAKEADFFSFGTNDLTQMTYGFSRDDIGSFLPKYLEKGILEKDPMSSIDKEGVGYLMEICIELARTEKPNLEIGICGEHGGDPESVEFCHKIGLNYVSCSPFRVPIAKLASAQAVLKEK